MTQFNLIHDGFGEVFESGGFLSVCGFEVDFVPRQGDSEFQALGGSGRVDDDIGPGLWGRLFRRWNRFIRAE